MQQWQISRYKRAYYNTAGLHECTYQWYVGGHDKRAEFVAKCVLVHIVCIHPLLARAEIEDLG